MPPSVLPVNPLVTLARAGDPVRVGSIVPGSPDEFSDWARWHDPNVRSAQYCAADSDVLWQRAARIARLGGVRFPMLAHNRGPVLLELTQSAQHPYDVRVDSGSQIPSNFAQVASTACRVIAEQGFTAGADALVVPTAEAAYAGADEYVLDVAACPTEVTSRMAAKDWL
jgi:hypothetical protein